MSDESTTTVVPDLAKIEDAVARVRALHANSWCCFGTHCPTIAALDAEVTARPSEDPA